MKVAATLQITSKGQPVIYYGEEIGLTGENNYPYYDNRYDFDWTEVETQKTEDNSFYNHYKTLLNICRDYSEVFAKGNRTVLTGSDATGYEVIRRSYEGENVYVGTTYTVAEDGSLTVAIPKATAGGTAILVKTAGENATIEDTNTVTIKLHYDRSEKDNDYTDWNVWFWAKGKSGAQYDFAEENGEMVATFTVEGRATSKVNYIIRKGDWKEKDVDPDQEIDISDVVSGTIHFYIKAGIEGGTRILGPDAIVGSKIVSASYDNTTNKIIIETSRAVSGSLTDAFEIKRTDGITIGVSGVKEEGKIYTLTLVDDLSSISALSKSYLVRFEGYAPVTKEISVNIVTVSKVNVTADASIVESGKTTGLRTEIVTTGGFVPKDMITVEWDSLKTDIATVTADGSDKLAAILTGVKAGTAQVKASVTIFDGKASKTFVSGKKSIKVSATAFAQITFKDIEKFTKKDNSNVYVYPFTESTKAVVTIESTASKLKLKSSDNKVVSVGRVSKNAEGNFTAELTIKKAGYIELTATANDAVKTTAAVQLYVKDATPNVSTDKVELNNKAAKTASVSVYANEGYAIESVNIDSTVFAITRATGDEYIVSMEAGTEKGNYKQTLTIKVKDAGEYQVPLTISVVSKEPAVKVKQTGKVNLFYTDKEANGSLTITSTETISSVVLKDCDFEYNNETKEISLKEGADRTNPDKKGVVSVTLKDYAEPIEKNITISTENKAPKLTLSAKAASIYPTVGIETAQVSITDVTTDESIAAEDMKVTFKQVKGKDVTAYAVEKAVNSVSFTRTDNKFTSKATADIAVQKSNFSKPVNLTFAISVNTKAPSLVLSKKAMTLNKNAAVSNYEADTVIVNIKNAPSAVVNNVSVEAANAKAQKELGTSIVFEISADGKITAKLKDTANLSKGTYKFNVNATLTETCTLKTTVSVKIVDVVPEKTVTLKQSGSIDVLNRDTTALMYTPKLKNITGEIVDVKLTGRAAHLFKAELEDGKIKVTVKGNNKEEQNKVYYEGCADSEKAATVTYKVKVK